MSRINPRENQKLIRLAPPLVVQTADLSGQLVALNQEQLVIQWENKKESFAGGPISIELTASRKIMLSTMLQSDLIVPADENSATILTDLLHQIRKEQHIHICATENVEAQDRDHGFANIKLPHVALPELSWGDLDCRRTFMGREFGAPILITGMTGGIDKAAMINERLAHAANKFNLPMGVGSQRLAIENPDHAGIFRLKEKFPNLFLIANVGIAQILTANWRTFCETAVSMIEADALAIHVNVLQELVQVEGDRNFRGVIERIGMIVQALKIPVLVKEVGAGLDAQSIQALYNVGVRYFDVGGKGGTSWAFIEGRRSLDPTIQRLGNTFRDWGISTGDALLQARALKLPDTEFVATGGIRDGVTVLKSLYAGATMAGIGLPLFRAALKDALAPTSELDQIILELKIAMMCGGTGKLAANNHSSQ